MRRRLLILAAGSWPVARFARAQGTQKQLRIGLTAVILADQAAFLSRWSQYLAERINVPVVFIVRDSYQPILDLLFSGQLDAAWICGYPFVRFEPRLRLLAVPLYQGKATYQSYLIRARGSDTGIQGWQDLRGKVFAYSDPLSNSGWLVPQGQLIAAGIGPNDFKKTFFAYGHRNVAEAVAAKLAQAGAIDGYVWETMRLQSMKASEATEVIWRSEWHGFPPLVTPVQETHPKSLALQQTLLSMQDDNSGQDLLRALNLTGFTAGTSRLFDSIRRLALSIPGTGVQA